jgi:hypothetical protein
MSRRGFVEEEQRRSGQQEMSDLDPAFHAEGAVLSAPVCCVCETDHIEGTADACLLDVGEAAYVPEVLVHGQLWDQGGLMAEQPDCTATGDHIC